jgi:regulator of sigma E protease
MAESTKLVTVDFERDGSQQTKLIVTRTGESMLGISWQGVQYRTPALSPAQAVVTGAKETLRTVGILAHGLTMLFRGINLTEAVSGPLRMTYMAGEIAVAGFQHSGIWGMLYSAVNFLALISLALGLMNMLPLPMLDGGQVVLFAVEAVRRRPTHPKVLRTFQTVGVAIIFSIMAFALFGDLRFLGGQIVP